MLPGDLKEPMSAEKARPLVKFEDLGLRPYEEAWNYQTGIHKSLIAAKMSPEDAERLPAAHRLLFVEHPPVYTMGKSGKEQQLLFDEEELAAQGIEYVKINRGGAITYHGPGQLVVYPIFDLDDFFHDVRRYVSHLEQVVINTLAHYGLDATRNTGYTGVWMPPVANLQMGRPRKICAIGVHMSRWVTLHGLAFNIYPDLTHYRGIIPCGLDPAEFAVTTMEAELGYKPDFEEVKQVVKEQFRHVFSLEFAA